MSHVIGKFDEKYLENSISNHFSFFNFEEKIKKDQKNYCFGKIIKL
jgi:hypothetical protein